MHVIWLIVAVIDADADSLEWIRTDNEKLQVEAAELLTRGALHMNSTRKVHVKPAAKVDELVAECNF